MTAEIITIGDELLIGQVINTNQAYIAEKLNTVGVFVERMTTVGDNRVDILQAFRSAWEMYDVVCVTGGLGPTHDDITKKLVCEFFNTDLVKNDECVQRREGSFCKDGTWHGRNRQKGRCWFRERVKFYATARARRRGCSSKKQVREGKNILSSCRASRSR